MIIIILMLGHPAGVLTTHLHLPAPFHFFFAARVVPNQPPFVITGIGDINVARRLQDLLELRDE
jgi:hypothetical protein